MLVGEREALVQVFQEFRSYPTTEEAWFISGVEVGMAPNADKDRVMLRAYRSGDLWRLVTTGNLPGFEPTWWHRGALALTPKPFAMVMALLDSVVVCIKALIKGRNFNPAPHRTSLVRNYAKYLRWLLVPVKN